MVDADEDQKTLSVRWRAKLNRIAKYCRPEDSQCKVAWTDSDEKELSRVRNLITRYSSDARNPQKEISSTRIDNIEKRVDALMEKFEPKEMSKSKSKAKSKARSDKPRVRSSKKCPFDLSISIRIRKHDEEEDLIYPTTYQQLADIANQHGSWFSPGNVYILDPDQVTKIIDEYIKEGYQKMDAVYNYLPSGLEFVTFVQSPTIQSRDN